MAERTYTPSNLPKWMTGVEVKLSKEGLLLLKLLYYGELPQRQLQDEIDSPKDLYHLAAQGRENDETVLACFIHRIHLLVPQSQPAAEDPAKILKAKDLGAQACLDHLQWCDLPPPSIQVDDLNISSKSKLMECLVMAYVNMSPRRRQNFREQLADQVGVYREGFNIFQLVCQLFQRESEAAENVVGRIVNALNNAPVPEAIVKNLKGQLVSYDIPHQPFDIQTREDTEEDYEPPPITMPSKPFCTKRMAIHCLVPFIPILLLVLAITVATPSLMTRDQPESSQREYEVTSTHNPFPNPWNSNCSNTSKVSPLIHLGNVYSRWYREVLITQLLPKNGPYVRDNFMVYVVPSEHVIEQKKWYYCNGTFPELAVSQLYLLQGSVMNFNVCISSTNDTFPGWVNLSIYDDFESYHIPSTGIAIELHKIYVDANQSNCSSYTYTAPNDSFYYASAGNQDETCRAKVISFSVDIEINYINLTDLLNESYSSGVCNQTGTSEIKPCSVAITGDWLFSARNYDIFVFVISPSKISELGLVRWQLSFQSVWYAVPAIAGAIVFLPILFMTVGCSYCVYRKKGQKGDYKELHAQI